LGKEGKVMPRLSSNKIYSQASSEYLVSWFFAIIWNGITWFAIIKGGDNILQAFDENPVFYFFALFPFIGVMVVYTAIKQTLAWFKFGKTPLILDAGDVGGLCAGSITLPILIKDATQAKLSLNCKRRYVQRGSDGKSSTREQVIWQDKVTLKPERYGRKKIQLKFLFDTPKGLPVSEDKSRDYHLWQLRIKLPVPGIDYERIFELPMQVVDEHAVTASHFSEAQSSELIEHKETERGLIPIVKKTAKGTEFYFGYGRSKLMAMVIMFFGLGFGAFGYLFFSGFDDFLPITSILMMAVIYLVALACVLLGLFIIVNSLTVEVGLAGIHKRQVIFGFKLEEQVELNNIADIISEQNASSTSGTDTRVWYALKLLTHDGRKIAVADSLEGQSYANEIRQEMIAALGHSWQASAAKQALNKTKKPLPKWARYLGKLASYSFTLALLYDLSGFFPEIAEFFTQISL